jgi:ATP-binding cassette, subfamily B, bacterial
MKANMQANIKALCWPLARLGEGMEELARRAGLTPSSSDALNVPASVAQGGSAEVARWIEWAGGRLGLEAEAVEVAVSACGQLIAGAGPALFYFADDDGPCFVLLLRSRRGVMQLIGPDLTLHRCPVELLRAVLCGRHEAPLAVEIDKLLATAGVTGARRDRARQAMLQERLASQQVGSCWILRLPPSTGFWRQLTQARLPRRIALMIALFAAGYGLEIIGWSLIGKAALNGRLDTGWLAAWVLLVLSIVPLRLFGGWLNAAFALDAGRILKSRLLAGALQIDLESVKHVGAGQLLGRVMESQALESLALNGGMAVLIALIELVFSGWILAAGAGGAAHLALLLCWLAVTLWLSWRYFRRMRNWTRMRIDMTHDLVERMVGHRTRLAQEWPQRRDGQDDQSMRDYLHCSRQMDNAIAPIAAVVPGGWMLIGLIGLAPAFMTGMDNAASLAIGLGGVLLANRALSGLSSGLAGLARAGIAWKQVAPFFHSAANESHALPFLSSAQITGADDNNARQKLIDASSLVFRYRPEGEAVLRGVDLSIHRGDRILLEGPSGGGKSTLASILVGLRKPDSGLLLLNGLDRHTLGDSWRRLATEAPQFHENHILAGTIGFNLLMGRNWPATEDELAEAHAICDELGLGELLERMPSGMRQMVGETGWQLSHGERSRLFLARALLQKTQLTILDESFAALDPETLSQCLDCAFRRATTLIVVAHP